MHYCVVCRARGTLQASVCLQEEIKLIDGLKSLINIWKKVEDAEKTDSDTTINDCPWFRITKMVRRGLRRREEPCVVSFATDDNGQLGTIVFCRISFESVQEFRVYHIMNGYS